MRRFYILLWLFYLTATSVAENYLINGGQESRINYQLIQRVEPSSGIKSLSLSFVVPESFNSPTYRQKIENFNLNLLPRPTNQKEKRDRRGNKIIQATWKNPKRPIDVTMTFTAYNSTILRTLNSNAPFPLKDIPSELKDYLLATKLVQSSNQSIKQKADELTRGVKTEFDAVQRILTWVVDNMRYVTPPERYDALYSFGSGRGNCQNYSHLSAALMRSVGIPVRIVNGVTLKKPYTVKTPEGNFTFKMGQGRHSWIEVYFPDLKWVPFDPQQTELFVSNRFVRIEVGVDNEETINDGMVRWRQTRGVSGKPKFQEVIEAEFPVDNVDLTLQKQKYGPKAMLICPKINATFKAVKITPPAPPKKISEDKLKQMKFDRPFLFGNLDFPKGVNFAFTRGPAVKGKEDEYTMKKNFMVETAEYVTTKMTQYGQAVVLSKPVKLTKIGLALHKFGGNGQLWVELMDDDNGKPGKLIATSDFIALTQLPIKPGYDWVDFNFSREAIKLSPGKYWISLGFTGSPIVNWFYTYGKPVGPVDGTRYKSVYEDKWSGALAYEFNYRIKGWTTR